MADPAAPDPAAPPAPAPSPEPAPVVAPAAVEPAPVADAPKTVAETPSLIETAAVVEPAAKPDAAAAPDPAVAKPAAEGDKAAADATADQPAADAPKLGADGKPIVEAKPGDKPADKPADAPKAVEAAPLTYAKFELPEGIELVPEKLEKATAILGKFQVPQEMAQELVSLHTATMQEYATHLLNEQQRVFAEYRANNRKEIMADEVLGGAGHQTAMGVVARMRDRLVPEAEREAFNQFARITGAGDHPVFVRMMHRAGLMFEEAAPSPTPHNPPPDAGKPKGGRRGALYDHPSSVARRQQQ